MNKNIFIIIGITIVITLFLLSGFASLLSPYNPADQNLYERLQEPGLSHLLGQDSLGRDILSRLIYGSRVSLKVGFLTIFISGIIGTFVGSVAGYYGGRIDRILMQICDIFLAFPGLLMAITLIAILGPGLNNVIFALCIMGWVSYARLVRGQILSLKNLDYIQAAVACGISDMRIILKHLLPNLMTPIIVHSTFGMAGAIVAEAGLSFLGLGVQPPETSWGMMLSEGRKFLLIAPHMTTFPGLAIMIVVLGLNLLGDGLRDKLDVKREQNL
ncbi:MAG TPA: nickel transporter permease [Nitrospinota bacterium]|nr:nickel transporter permease [Nitrospinota bacterium]